MMKVDVLIDLFFSELPFPERVAQIAQCGYRYIETWKGGDAAELKAMSDAGKACDVELVGIVMNGPNDATVAPVQKKNRDAFMDQMDRYSDNALAAGCQQGIVTTGPSVVGCDYQEQRKALIEALSAAGELVGKKGFKLNLEPLNTEVDHAGYFLSSPEDAVAIVKEIGLDNVKILFDLYHMEIMRGNQTVFIENNIDWIGHFHAAGVPGRHEIFNGETNYPFVVNKIEQSGYEGYFGLEYFPELPCPETLVKTLGYLRGDV